MSEAARVPWDAPAWGADRPRYYNWSELLRRVFLVDVLECENCGGRREVIAVLVHQPVVRAFLECLGPGDRAPPAGSSESESEAEVEETVLDLTSDEEAAEQGVDELPRDEYT